MFFGSFWLCSSVAEMLAQAVPLYLADLSPVSSQAVIQAAVSVEQVQVTPTQIFYSLG